MTTAGPAPDGPARYCDRDFTSRAGSARYNQMIRDHHYLGANRSSSALA